MKRTLFGAAVLSAVTLSFCAQAQEAPVNMRVNTTPVQIAKADTGCTPAKVAISGLDEGRGSAGFMTAASCGSERFAKVEETKAATRKLGYAAGANDRGAQITTGASARGDRGSLFSFFKADASNAGKKRVKVEARARKSVSASTGGKASSGKYGSLIASYAAAHGVPVKLAHAVIRVESNYRASARGAAGEIGLMQLKLSTARMMGYRGSAKGLYNPETNIKYGMKYLAKARQLSGGTTCGTILKYNAGHGAKRMNPVSARYCSKVKRYL